ncbi:MAG: T9SS type A sorting domain-containing protein [Bacteroidetes bacterium]|nr:T9SS type A sorting domain-containing protein [Bacteroidota bacterium]MBL0053537.1 T9SS type A sorting domain-containing protein [Bacteroidota bacterium]
MKSVFILIFFFVAQEFGLSQNLVPNGNFENTIPYNSNPCPACIDSVNPWFMGLNDESPDYFNGQYGLSLLGLGVPMNFWGCQFAKSGVAYAGFAPYHPWGFTREYLSVSLLYPLLKNHNYFLRFYVSFADSCKYATDRVGAYLSVDTPNFVNVNFGLIPQVENLKGNIISDSMNWTPIVGYYMAQGGEKVLTFGNFYNNANTQITMLPYNNPWYGSYYYLDEVSLIDCTATFIQEIELPQFNLYPNPATDILNIQSEQGFARLLFYNSVGDVALQFSQTLETNFACDVAILPKGIYIVAIEDKYGRMVYKKFVKM